LSYTKLQICPVAPAHYFVSTHTEGTEQTIINTKKVRSMFIFSRIIIKFLEAVIWDLN